MSTNRIRNNCAGIACFVMLYSCLNSCQTEEELKYGRYFVNGKGLYEQHCQNCHSKEGAGLAMLIPPLDDSTFLRNNRNQLPCIIRYGQHGKISVNGKIYDEKMPAQEQLASIEIAEIITYITNSFGNKQGMYDVSTADGDLKGCN